MMGLGIVGILLFLMTIVAYISHGCVAYLHAEGVLSKNKYSIQHFGISFVSVVIMSLITFIIFGNLFWHIGYRKCVVDTQEGVPAWVRTAAGDGYIWEHKTYSPNYNPNPPGVNEDLVTDVLGTNQIRISESGVTAPVDSTNVYGDTE